jgi:hypothetical protein
MTAAPAKFLVVDNERPLTAERHNLHRRGLRDGGIDPRGDQLCGCGTGSPAISSRS